MKRHFDPRTGLTVKQEMFCQALARGLSQTDSYRKAFPHCKGWQEKSIHERASALAATAKVRSRVDELFAIATRVAERRFGITTEQTLEEIARIALSDVRALFTTDGKMRAIKSMTAAEAACIASIECEVIPGSRGAPEQVTHIRRIKLWNKNDALEKLAKHLGLYREDNLQKNGGLFDGLPRADIVAIRDFLLALRPNRSTDEPSAPRLQ